MRRMPLPTHEDIANAEETKVIGKALCDFLEREFPDAPNSERSTRNMVIALMQLAGFMAECCGLDLVKVAAETQALVRATTTVNSRNELVSKREPKEVIES